MLQNCHARQWASPQGLPTTLIQMIHSLLLRYSSVTWLAALFMCAQAFAATQEVKVDASAAVGKPQPVTLGDKLENLGRLY